MDEGFDFIVDLRGEVLCDGGEGGIGTGIWGAVPADEPVGNVDVAASRSNQSILKEISPGISLEGMMLKLKLHYFGHLV